MKKTVLIVSSFVLICSLIFAVPLISQAVDTDSAPIVNIDFSEEYYSSNSKVEQYNGARGKALRFDRVSISTETWGKSVLHKLGDENGDLDLPIAHELKVKLEVRNEVLHPATAGGTDYRPYNIGIVYLTDTEVENAREATGGGLKTYANRIIKIAEVEGVIHSDFVNVSGEITVPTHSSDACAYLVLYADYQTAFDKTKIWIDNIKIYDTGVPYAHITFAEDYYVANHSGVIGNVNGKNSIKFTRVSIDSTNLAANNLWGNAQIYGLSQGTELMQMPANTEVTISLEIYKKTLVTAVSDNGGFNVGVFFLSDADKTKITSNTDNKSNNKSFWQRIIKIGTVDGNTTTDYEKLSATVMLPSHRPDAYPYLVLYSDYQTNFNNEIYVAGLKIKKAELTENEKRYTRVDFDSNSQPNFYSVTNNVWFATHNYNASSIKDLTEDTVQKNVWNVTKLFGDGANYYASSNAPALTLTDNTGKNSLQFNAGETFDISLAIKNGYFSNARSNVYVALIFDNYNITEVGGWGNDCGLNYYKTNNLLFDIGKIDETVDAWQTLKATITVPQIDSVQNARIVLYQKGRNYASEDVEYYIDNITTTKLYGDVNSDDAVNIVDMFAMKRDIIAGSTDVKYDLNCFGGITDDDIGVLRNVVLYN